MGSGDLTASTPTLCTSGAAIKAAVDALNLSAATDFIKIIPVGNGQTLVFKVEREA